MPHVPRPVRISVDASVEVVREAAQRLLGVTPEADGALTGPLPDWADTSTCLRLALRPVGTDATEVTLEIENPTHVPYWEWLIGSLLRQGERRTLRYHAARLEAEVNGRPLPKPRRRSPLLPPVPFQPTAIALLATVAAIAALANFGGALFGQTADPVTDAFGQSTKALGVSLAVSRGGVLVSLVASALADRQGRRRLLLFCFAGVCVTNAISAFAPGFAVFTGAQVLTRAFANATFVVAAIAAVEEAPEGARAYALSMLALAYGAGFAIAVVLLPISDIAEQSWRVAFAISALSILLLPRLARSLRETGRYTDLARRKARRGRVRDIFEHAYGYRFVLRAVAARLPSSPSRSPPCSRCCSSSATGPSCGSRPPWRSSPRAAARSCWRPSTPSCSRP